MAHIFLYGPPGSGKSTLGKALAESLQLPFVDLDQTVEMHAGMSISELMQQRGEDGFREAESRVLHGQMERPESVIALGGGTLLRAQNRWLAESNGRVICLGAEGSLLGERLRSAPAVRPLLQEDLDTRLSGLLAARSSHYDSFTEQLDSAGSPAEVVLQLQAMIGRFRLTVMGGSEIISEAGALDRLGEMLREREAARVMLVTDENVSKLHSARLCDALRGVSLDPATMVIPAGEACKNLETVSRLWQGFLQAGLDRKSTVIALGGGVVSDLAGFAAATFMRGIDWVCVPTTVLSMVDASIGGKTGFDLLQGKNLVGSFHAPQLVLADPDLLESLPDAELRNGLAEMVKHGIIADPELFRACGGGLASVKRHLAALIRRAVAVKVRIVENDPYESGGRAALNFGHTVGHAIELVSGYRIAHGEAVAIGMVAESRLAERLGIARRGLPAEIAQALSGLGLPVRVPPDLPRPELAHAMQADKKKASGVVRFALPVDIGRVQINVAVSEPESALEEG